MKYSLIVLLLMSLSVQAQELYTIPENKQAAWSSFENPKATKGAGGKENKGAKGHPAEVLKPGESKILLDEAGMNSFSWVALSCRQKLRFPL